MRSSHRYDLEDEKRQPMNMETVMMDWAEFAHMPVVKTREQAAGLSASGIASKRVCSTGQWLCMGHNQQEFLPHVDGKVHHGVNV
jgi:hypothetical protein